MVLRSTALLYLFGFGFSFFLGIGVTSLNRLVEIKINTFPNKQNNDRIAS